MTQVITVTEKTQLETAAVAAYNATIEEDGTHRGFSAAKFEELECRATECFQRIGFKSWFSFRYYLNGRAIAKAKI
jgi:hypothetical protein